MQAVILGLGRVTRHLMLTSGSLGSLLLGMYAEDCLQTKVFSTFKTLAWGGVFKWLLSGCDTSD